MDQKGFTLLESLIVIIVFIIAIGGITGWVWNIIKIFGTMSDPITGYFIVRCIGVCVAPLGAVIGWM